MSVTYKFSDGSGNPIHSDIDDIVGSDFNSDSSDSFEDYLSVYVVGAPTVIIASMIAVALHDSVTWSNWVRPYLAG